MSAKRATYLDSSAIVKLVVQEPESAALSRYLRGRGPIVASALALGKVVTYDARMAEAARGLGWSVMAPA